MRDQDALDLVVSGWCATQDKFELQSLLRTLPIPVAAVMKPAERIDGEHAVGDDGLWPVVRHSAMGDVRVDGQPVRFSRTDWAYERAGPCLGEHTEEVLAELLGMTGADVAELREAGVV